MAKKTQLNIQLETEWKATFDAIYAATGLNDQAIVKAFIHSLVEHYRVNKELRFPLTLAESHGGLLMVAEDREAQLKTISSAVQKIDAHHSKSKPSHATRK